MGGKWLVGLLRRVRKNSQKVPHLHTQVVQGKDLIHYNTYGSLQTLLQYWGHTQPPTKEEKTYPTNIGTSTPLVVIGDCCAKNSFFFLPFTNSNFCSGVRTTRHWLATLVGYYCCAATYTFVSKWMPLFASFLFVTWMMLPHPIPSHPLFVIAYHILQIHRWTQIYKGKKYLRERKVWVFFSTKIPIEMQKKNIWYSFQRATYTATGWGAKKKSIFQNFWGCLNEFHATKRNNFFSRNHTGYTRNTSLTQPILAHQIATTNGNLVTGIEIRVDLRSLFIFLTALEMAWPITNCTLSILVGLMVFQDQQKNGEGVKDVLSLLVKLKIFSSINQSALLNFGSSSSSVEADFSKV